MEKNYRDFSWNNQMVGDVLVSKVKVQIHKPVHTVVSEDGCYSLVLTDGFSRRKSKHGSTTYTSKYSYVLLSTELFKKPSEKYYLSVKLYITDTFQPSQLIKEDFLGKEYVFQALEQCHDFDLTPVPKTQPLAFEEHLKSKDLLTVYHLLRTHAERENFEQVEQLFEDYNISMKYQAVFWKEMYVETAKNQK